MQQNQSKYKNRLALASTHQQQYVHVDQHLDIV